MKASDFNVGDPVTYVPNHADGDAFHPDCEQGTVSTIKEGVEDRRSKPTAPAPRHWDMFAQDYGDGLHMHFGSKRYVDMHGGDEPTVPVRLTEDPDGRYHGWVYTDKDVPTMIWPSAAQLNMCFAYGMQAEVDKGCGVPIRMRCEALPLKVRLTKDYADAEADVVYPSGTILERTPGGQYSPPGLGLGEHGSVYSFSAIQDICTPYAGD